MSSLKAYHSIISAQDVKALLVERYGLATDVIVSFLKQGINDIYLVEAEQKYIFRIARAHRFVSFNRASYVYEVEALNFLKGEGIPVSAPIADRNGQFLGSAVLPEGERYYALFEFIEGATSYPTNAEAAQKVGKALGQVHNRAARFQTETDRGFALDLHFLLEKPLTLLQQQERLIGTSGITYLTTLCNQVREELDEYVHDCEQGLIQGDFWWSNYHEHQGEISFFDFDYCGPGWFVYDLAAFIGTAKGLNYDLSNGLEAALIAGYESERPLNNAEKAATAPFSMARIIWGLGLWCTLIPMEGEQWFVKSMNDGLAQLKSLTWP